MIDRQFQEVPEGKLDEVDQQSFLVSLGWSTSSTWDDLLKSKRVLIVSEAGAGKTYECQTLAHSLWDKGNPAFFIDLAALAKEGVRALLNVQEEARFDEWLMSEMEIATFFLDSIDELKLSAGNVKQALMRFRKDISSKLDRVQVIITTRPIPFDEEVIRQQLPVPAAPSSDSIEEKFAKVVTREHEHQTRREEDTNAAPDWRLVAIMPLSDPQIVEFSRGQGVEDPELLLEDLERRNAQEFARRPQDLVELCADWQVHNRVRSHREQITTNIRVKLQASDDRAERTDLSVAKAIGGAGRLALAMQLTRRSTVRHNAASDDIPESAALDPALHLQDWSANERKVLLERPLFGFASYGRVRFHHRSVTEYLAAQRLCQLRSCGMSFSALKRLLFAETRGKTIVRPSKRPIAGWLALEELGIFELLRDHEPALLLTEGDPESLSNAQRCQALEAYVARYGKGGWRGLHVPHIQVNRFATPELADVITRVWATGVENPDVRETILELIEAGRLGSCADIAHEVACNSDTSTGNRMAAIDALVAVGDSRLKLIAKAVANGDSIWPDRTARGAVLRLFPGYMSVVELRQALENIKPMKRTSSSFGWEFPRLILAADLCSETLAELRDAIVSLVCNDLSWRNKWPHFTCSRRYLSAALAAVCCRGIDKVKSDSWLDASVLALRLHHREYGNNEIPGALRDKLKALGAQETERLFWAADQLVQSLHRNEDPWQRLVQIEGYEPIVELRVDRDLNWLQQTLANRHRHIDERAMALIVTMRLLNTNGDWQQCVERLRPFVADAPELVGRIEAVLRPPEIDLEQRDWEIQTEKRAALQKAKEAQELESWIQVRRSVVSDPDHAFSTTKIENTTRNLWWAMCQEGNRSQSTGWNRAFVEEYFDIDVANRLRDSLMSFWRNVQPTLPSERSKSERGTRLVFWEIGKMGISAEAEDSDWAKKLDDKEAAHAARYAPIELDGLPTWLEDLVLLYPKAVDQTLGEELTWYLNQVSSEPTHSSLLQGIGYGPTTVAQNFIPRLQSWLDETGDSVGADSPNECAEILNRVKMVCKAIVKHGDNEQRLRLSATAQERLTTEPQLDVFLVWLSELMRLDASLGIAALERRARMLEPGERTEIVQCLAVLFGSHRDPVDLSDSSFTPQLLLRLLRFAYCHVRKEDDAHHEESFTPDYRDDAERARDAIVNALLNTQGEEAWVAKQEMALDPLCAHFRDRIFAVAEENWAHEIDGVVFNDGQALALDSTGESPPATNEAMFAIMKDRLSDLNDLQLRDDSPREAWASIKDERIMRREIARELRHASKGVYAIGQEGTTADENRTDIRLRSTEYDHEAVIGGGGTFMQKVTVEKSLKFNGLAGSSLLTH